MFKKGNEIVILECIKMEGGVVFIIPVAINNVYYHMNQTRAIFTMIYLYLVGFI